MAHVEPMDIDGIESDYEDKENSILHSNVNSKLPCAEKGYEELDVSEFNMKLRYSITPASSPMSKSYTANCKDNKSVEDKNNSFNNGNADLTSSFNSTLTSNNLSKTTKVSPFQSLPTDNLNDTNRNILVPKSLDNEENNITITVNDSIDENFSIPSTSSSLPHTPEATTPTKELPKDGGSPIMRGLRSVLSMFKPQSPQPSHEQPQQNDGSILKADSATLQESELRPIEVSTPLHTTSRISPKRTSPLKDSLVFHDDLEKELQWKDDSTILFKEEKIPKHKLFLQESVTTNLESKILNKTKEEGNKTLEYMDISYNDSILNDKTMTDVETKAHSILETGGMESDGEFVDCETTYTKDEVESLLKSKENISMHDSVHVSINTEFDPSGYKEDNQYLNTIPINSPDLVACTSNNMENSKFSATDISENDNIHFNNVSKHSKDRSLCETEFNLENNVCDAEVKNCSASNMEVTNDNEIKQDGSHNVTGIIQCKEKQITDKSFLSCENETNPNLSQIGNQFECRESLNDKINDLNVDMSVKEDDIKPIDTACVYEINVNIPMKQDDVKDKVEDVINDKCNNAVQFGALNKVDSSNSSIKSLTSDMDSILSQIDNQISTSPKNREIIESINSETILSLKDKTTEETYKTITETLPQTSSNINKTIEINVEETVASDDCRGILSQNNNDIEIKVCSESLNENNATNIVERLPIDIPLPSDSDFDKDFADIICDANNIPGYTNNNVNQDFQSLQINADEGLNIVVSNETSIVMEKVPIENAVCNTMCHTSNIVNSEAESTLDTGDNKCGNNCMVSNETSIKDTSFEIVRSDQELSNMDITLNEEDKGNQIIESTNSNIVYNVIDEKPKNISNNSLQLSNVCDTNSNFEKLDEEVFSNMKQLSNPLETKDKLQISPLLSPLPSNKGYNIDFDDIEDPFATKTKIRLSPTPESLGQVSLATEDINISKVSPKLNKSSKRKSYPIKKPINNKKNSLNATFDCSDKDSKENIKDCDTIVVNKKKEDTFDSSFNPGPTKKIEDNSTNNSDFDLQNKTICLTDNKYEIKEDDNLISECKDPSPVRDITKSVFNCPEINDINYCSFSDTQKTVSSDLMMASEDMILEHPKIDSLEYALPDILNDQETPNKDGEISVSRDSKNSDVKEVNTEDEDTATFNETMEFTENDIKENVSSVKDLLAFDVSHAALDSDNVDNGEMFIDAEAFEFLLNQNKSNIIADSGKESLFLKFDPLFTKRVSSDGIIAALKRVQNNQSTPKKLTKIQLDTTTEMPGPSPKETLNDGNDDASIQAMSKPMMVVNPAINSIVSPRKVVTPKLNRQSLTFSSPAMAVIDKLLSLSGNSLTTDHNTPASSPVRQHNETDIAITQLREMLADKDIHVHNLRSESKELKERLSNLEAQVKSLEVESAERLKKVNDLNERLLEKTKLNKSMANVVEEYERTIASLITQIEQEKKNNAEERIMLIKERDEQTAHLASMEVSFNDLHSKYEKSKQLIYSMKANEDTYKKSIQDFEESLAKMQNNYELLKQHATSKLNHANMELEKFNRAHEAEVLKLNALIKRKELHITSLEETLAQKTKANEELTAICDELINKVG